MNEVGAVAMVRVPIIDLDGNDAPPLKDEVASFQVLVGGAAQLNVRLLIDAESPVTRKSPKSF